MNKQNCFGAINVQFGIRRRSLAQNVLPASILYPSVKFVSALETIQRYNYPKVPISLIYHIWVPNIDTNL